MITELLSQKAFWAALCIGIAGPLFGRHLALSRSILLGLALPQVSLAGVAFVLMGAGCGWGWCLAVEGDSARAFLGAALFTLPVLWFLSGRRRPPLSEATLAFLYLAAAASTGLLLSGSAAGEGFAQDLFRGQLLLLDATSFAVLAATLAVCSLPALLWRRRILLSLCDPEFAESAGVCTRRWRRLAALLDGAALSVTVATAGPLVAFALMILPVLAAAAFARSLRAHLGWACALGGATAAAGAFLSYRYDLPLGDCVVAAGCAGCLLAWGARRIGESVGLPAAATQPARD